MLNTNLSILGNSGGQLEISWRAASWTVPHYTCWPSLSLPIPRLIRPYFIKL